MCIRDSVNIDCNQLGFLIGVSLFSDIQYDMNYGTEEEEYSTVARNNNHMSGAPHDMSTVMDSIKGSYTCPKCNKQYCYIGNLKMHLKYECGLEPQFQCSYCPLRSKLKGNLMKHIRRKHRNIVAIPAISSQPMNVL